MHHRQALDTIYPFWAARLTDFEKDGLIARLERGVSETAPRFLRHTMMIGALFAGLAIALGPIRGCWFHCAAIALLGCACVALGVAAIRRTNPERMKPVINALRAEPHRVTAIRHLMTSDSSRVLISHWIEVETDSARLAIRANCDWAEVFEKLARLCPHASVLDS